MPPPPLDPPIPYAPAQVREALAPLRNDFSIALWAPGNAFAVGAVVRVAHSYLAKEIFVVGVGGWYPKASMGMHKYEDVVRVADGAALLEATAGRPVWVIEKEGARRSLHDVTSFPAGVVLVFGSERSGVPDEVLGRANDVIGIPIYGVNNSLPLAVAAGIVMNEWARRKYVDGAVV
jgi:tRNA G18 (ribose-2'-O)-methylase SpoU